jgi:hypothetical protein
MNGEIDPEAAQFPEKEYINGIFLAVHGSRLASDLANVELLRELVEDGTVGAIRVRF